jgi:hypothetical protein
MPLAQGKEPIVWKSHSTNKTFILETLKSELFAEEQQQFLLRGIAVYFPHILVRISIDKLWSDVLTPRFYW